MTRIFVHLKSISINSFNKYWTWQNEGLCMVGWGRSIDRLVLLGLWILGSSLIGDISNISIISIRRVGDSLDSAIRKSNSVRSLDIAGTIWGLLSIEAWLGVVISNSIGVGVWQNFISIGFMVSWCMVGRCMVGWCMVGRGMMDSMVMYTIWSGSDNSKDSSNNKCL